VGHFVASNRGKSKEEQSGPVLEEKGDGTIAFWKGLREEMRTPVNIEERNGNKLKERPLERANTTDYRLPVGQAGERATACRSCEKR